MTEINNASNFTGDLKRQHSYVERIQSTGEGAFDLVATEAFVRGMRDSGYKSTATALDDWVDNSIQAGATKIDFLCVEGRQPKKKGGAKAIQYLAVVDDGHGMEPDMMRAAVRWGGTHRENNRDGLGRYGFGLPSAAVSMSTVYQVYSKIPGGDWYKLTINLHDIAAGKLTTATGQVMAPKAELSQLPEFVTTFLKKEKRTLESGTVVCVVDPDRLTTGYKRFSSLESKLMQHAGLIYRNAIKDVRMTMNGKLIESIDPLFLTPGCRHYDIGNGEQATALPPHTFLAKGVDEDGKEKEGAVHIRFSLMPPGFLDTQKEDGNTTKHKPRLAVMTENQSFLIVTRAGRQIDTVTKNPGTGSWAGLTTLVTNDRYWAVELDFDPVLDEAFGITVNKQQVSITDRMWEILEREGLPGHLAALRKQGVSARALKAKDSTKPESDTKRTSEEIMEESDKFQSSKNRANLRRNAEKTHPQIEQDASDIAESEGRDIGEVVGEILDETEKYPYQIEFESKPEAPFYRPELYGAQTRLWINKEHRFYRDVYNGPGSNTRLKTGLELLLLVLSMSELQSQGEKQMFYNRERSEWSTTLMTVLSLLNDKDPVDELEESSEMDLELSNVS